VTPRKPVNEAPGLMWRLPLRSGEPRHDVYARR
jgi:hypothetical protein